MQRVDSNVYRVSTIHHLLAVENGVVLLGLKQKVQDLSLPARKCPCNHKHDMEVNAACPHKKKDAWTPNSVNY